MRVRPRSDARRACRGVVLSTLVCGACGGAEDPALIEVLHAPDRYERRAGDFAASLTGRLSADVRSAEYRLADGPWVSIAQGPPRATPPGFTIELLPEDLGVGRNALELRAAGPGGRIQTLRHAFDYDPTPIDLPREIDWARAGALDVQDGAWEVIEDAAGVAWVRPLPGTEDYDRIVVVTGAFPGGRRVETSVVFRAPPERRGWGFGLFPLWGGQPDPDPVRPRRGWRFGLIWYSSTHGGIGTEFSEKIGGAEPAWVGSYRDFSLVPDTVYRIVSETRPVRDGAGALRAWRQRFKWWRQDEVEPTYWLDVEDRAGAEMPDGEYGVCLFTLRTAVEFGPVRVSPLEPAELDSPELDSPEPRVPG